METNTSVGSSARTAKLPLPTLAAAALTAVAFWALKPVFISVIGDRGDFAEVYVASASISVLVSIALTFVLRKKTRELLRGGSAALSGAKSAALSGLFLAIWYYGFYRALYSAPKVDATVIAFTWPLISAIAMRFFADKKPGPLNWQQWLTIIGSFIGAAAIGVSNTGLSEGNGSQGEIVWAFVAALGSGLYLPFAINSTHSFTSITRSSPIATFYAISVANGIALIAVLVVLLGSGYELRFYAFDAQVLVVCAMIGIGTYLLAEITWTWTFQEANSLTLSSLPYFSPALSVILLYLFFQEPVRPIAIVGMVLILFSNLTLHARHRSANALSLTLISTVFVALASQILPPDALIAVPEMAAALTGLFAILTGFILARVAGRRTQELDARAQLVRRLIDFDPAPGKELADRLLQDLIELEFHAEPFAKDSQSSRIRETLQRESPARNDARDRAQDALTRWQAIHHDRLSFGELAALWSTGLGSILFVILLRGGSPLGNLGTIVFAAGAFLAMFTIRDYDRNNIHGFTNQVLRLEQGFSEIGKDYYLPFAIVDSGELSSQVTKNTIRTRRSDDEDTYEVEAVEPARGFRKFYFGTAGVVIIALALLPATFDGISSANGSPPRPGVSQDLSGVARSRIVIADVGWAGSTVVSHIVSDTLQSSDISTEIVQMDHDQVLAEFDSEAPAVHVHPDFWLENQGAGAIDQVANGTVLLNSQPYTGRQGIYVLDNAETLMALDEFQDLEDPAVAALFDHDGGGSAEIWLGARGWSSTDLFAGWLEDHDFGYVEGAVYSETIFKARLSRYAEANLPMIFYGYEPDGIHERFPLRLVAAGPTSEGSGGSEVNIHVARSSVVDDVATEAARILSAVHFSAADVNQFISAVDQDGQSPAEVASQWIAANPDRVAQWLEE